MVKTRARATVEEKTETEPIQKHNGSDPTTDETAREQPRFLEDGFPNSAAMDVWDYMETLTEEQWNTHIWYLYRIEPRILKGNVGGNHLEKGSYALTPEDVKEKYGGRAFSLKLKREKQLIYTQRFAIEAIPKLQDDEVLETPTEKAEKAMAERDSTLVSTLVADVIAQRDRAISAGQKFDVSTAITQSMALHSKASEAVIEMVVNQAKKIAGGGSDGGLLETIKVLRDLGLIGTAAPAPNPFSQIKEMFELMRELGFEREGSGAATTNNPWVVLAQGIGQRMPDLIDRLAGVASDWRQGQEAITARAMAERGYKVRVIPGGDTPRPAAPAPAPVPPAPSSPPAPKGEEALLELYKHKLLQMFVNGVPGDEAAEAFDKLEPGFAQTVAALIRSKDPSLLTDPILGRMAQQPAAAQSFAADFLSYFDAATEEEETETTPVKH